jgi:GMP synthase PP-ATPase subunit
MSKFEIGETCDFAGAPRQLQHTARPCARRGDDLNALAGVDDPEIKRKTIGKLFIDVFEAEAKKLGRTTMSAACPSA